MVCPLKSIEDDGPKDAFNCYHTQLLDTSIKRAFGMLIHKWGCLRKPMPVNFKHGKINLLVLALCKLHNFCIDIDKTTDLPSTTNDDCAIGLAGGLMLRDGQRPMELLNAGHLVEPEHRTERKRAEKLLDLPVFKMLQHIQNQGYTIPPKKTLNSAVIETTTTTTR
ncbi:hypothetical protein IV203_006388 [Nitzschia inconspicua]|uniref:DDE Tnp4 domain-containing protein n=1 Tax=Nitzschia inconspicua TaxID=303405 RepID=A0A9K3P843_9STRA|nr:hypothetical protein IV203_006587 [Nitzschia inconspicua]KAG7339985.1 hypothetical protein IV203_006388 [Nitzschia inconspicua]